MDPLEEFSVGYHVGEGSLLTCASGLYLLMKHSRLARAASPAVRYVAS